jgi:RNA polymerase sigma factor (sigma-70 family)
MRTTGIGVTLEQLAAETGWLRQLANTLVNDRAAAEDLVHDTVLVAAEQGPRDGRPLGPWLACVMRNRARMSGRSASRRRRRERAVAELAVAPASPLMIIDKIEYQCLLAKLILELDQPLRDVVLLSYYEGLSSVAIGNRLGIADGTVRWRLKKAIDELRERLEQHAPNRAWIAPLTGLAGMTHPTGATSSQTVLLAAIFTLLAFITMVMPEWHPALGTATTTPRKHHAGLTASTWRAATRPSLDTHLTTSNLDGILPGINQHKLAGTVVDSMNRPVNDAELNITCSYGDEAVVGPAILHTASNGTFNFEVEQDCQLLMMARKYDAESPADAEVFGRRDPQKPPEPLVLQLTPTPDIVLKLIDAETGTPIAGARLYDDHLRAERDPAVSDENGIGWIRIANYSNVNHIQEITIDAPGYTLTRKKIPNSGNLHLDGPIEQIVPLVRGVRVSGRIVDHNRHGVANSLVMIEGTAGSEVHVTDDIGAFSIGVPHAGRYLVRASPPYLAMGRDAEHAIELEVGVNGLTDVVLQIPQEAHRMLTGIVIDSVGNPVTGARVRAAQREFRPAVTDAYGRFSFHIEHLVPLLSSGESVHQILLVARHGSFASVFTPVEIHNEDQDIVVTLQLGPADLAGIVMDLDGIPIPGADVRVNVCCDIHSFLDDKHVKTNAEGRFTLEVPRGTFILNGRRNNNDNYFDGIQVSGGSQDVRLVIP